MAQYKVTHRELYEWSEVIDAKTEEEARALFNGHIATLEKKLKSSDTSCRKLPNSERNKAILDSYKRGMKVAALSALYGVSEASVRAVIIKEKEMEIYPSDLLSPWAWRHISRVLGIEIEGTDEETAKARIVEAIKRKRCVKFRNFGVNKSSNLNDYLGGMFNVEPNGVILWNGE